MARRLSDVLGVKRTALEKQGAFDGFVDIDAPFHIDPYLLRTARTPELRQSHALLNNFFTKIIRLLEASQNTDDRFYREVLKRMQFPEINYIRLGYSLSGASGRGIGPKLGATISSTAKDLVAAGIKDPEIFELVGLLEEGVGADRISDMTIRIILEDLLAFSQRVCIKLGCRSRKKEYKSIQYDLPIPKNGGIPQVLVPSEILRHLPVALDWSEIDTVCAYNDALRARVNALIGRTWREAQTKHSKREIKNAILRHPELMKDLIALYNGKEGMHYDFKRDPEGLVAWSDISNEFTAHYPITIAEVRPTTIKEVLSCVMTICNQFATLIEDNGLNNLLYDGHKLKHERFAQLLFYGIADSYCAANNIDLSREPNAGRGPVDFKLSRGYSEKVTVEVKYSSNPATVRGFSKQLPEYNKAERTKSSVYMILRTTNSTNAIKTVIDTAAIAKKEGNRVPGVIVVDARRKPSASKK